MKKSGDKKEGTREVKLRVPEGVYQSMKSMSDLTGKSLNQMLMGVWLYSNSGARKKWLRDFIQRVEEMPDPFDVEDMGFDYCPFVAERMIDNSDRELAERSLEFMPSTPKRSIAEMTTNQEADAYLERIFWLMDEKDENIPLEFINGVRYWREHEKDIKNWRSHGGKY